MRYLIVRRIPALVAGVLFTLLAAVGAQDWQDSYDASGNFEIRTAASAITVPQILGQPQLQVVAPGELASFSVVMADARALTYQWRFNGIPLSGTGSTSDTLPLANVRATNEGPYSVVVANSSGSVTSAPAMLWLDSDGDGLPDSWELTYFGNLTSQRSLGDPDGDGVSNLDEFRAVTNPTNSASTLFSLTILSTGGSVAVVPARLSFTNGETVTLTATAFPPNVFRAWTGATNTQSNSVVLTMNTNKTLQALYSPMDIVWTNLAGGDWNVPSNWKPNLVPTTTDNAFITNTVTVTVNSATECGRLTLGSASSSPTLSGSGTFSIVSNVVWSSGTMSGSGRTIIAEGASLNIANPGTVSLTTRTLENGGTVLWLGAGNLNLGAAVITNRAGGLFHALNAATLNPTVAGSRFDNAGTFRKSVSAGATTVVSGMVFNNYSAVEIQTGTLSLGGGGTNSGSFTVPATALVQWTGGTFTLNSGAQLNGTGLYKINGGTLACNIDIALENLDLNGTLSGAGAVTVNHLMNWTGGTMSGSGRTIIPAGATLNVANAASVLLTSRTLENGGTVLWTGAASIGLTSTVITNLAGGLFETRGAGALNYQSGASSRFDNAGTFRKSVNTGTTTVSGNIGFNNYGTAEIQSGTLALVGGGTNSGTFDLSTGTTLNLSVGIFSSTAASIIAGAGNLTVGSGTANLAGLVNLSGTNTFSGGTANLTGNYICTNNTLIISGGTANLNGTGLVLPAVVNLSSGTLGGSQVVTVGSVMNWTGGTMSGSGRTIIPEGATLNVANAGTVFLNSRTLENGGTVLWTGAANIGLTSAVITNRAGALFQAQNAASLIPQSGICRFDNAGTFRKSVSSGTMAVGGSMAFNNYNLVEILTGTLRLDQGGSNTGTFDLSTGATLNLAVGIFSSTPASIIAGAGNLTVSGATANLAGLMNLSGTNTFSGGTANLTGNYICTNNTLIISGGTANFNGTGLVLPALGNLSSGTLGGSQVVTLGSVMNWTGGTMSGSGRTIIPAGATLNIANPSAVSLNTRTLEIGGAVLWTGAASIAMNSGAVITNRAGALFQVQNAATFNSVAGVNRFDNAGTFRKSASAGTTTVGGLVSFNNSGTVDIRTGILAANGGYASSSNALLNCALGGTAAGTNYGQLQVAGTVTLNGALSVDLTNGFSPALNDSFAVLIAGTRSGTFANFYYPSNEVTMVSSNTANSVIVRVTALLVVPRPVLLQPVLSGTDIRLIWTALSNVTYRLEYETDLGVTNWTGLAGDVTSLSNTASKLDALTSSNRFYRVRVIP